MWTRDFRASWAQCLFSSKKCIFGLHNSHHFVPSSICCHHVTFKLQRPHCYLRLTVRYINARRTQILRDSDSERVLDYWADRPTRHSSSRQQDYAMDPKKLKYVLYLIVYNHTVHSGYLGVVFFLLRIHKILIISSALLGFKYDMNEI